MRFAACLTAVFLSAALPAFAQEQQGRPPGPPDVSVHRAAMQQLDRMVGTWEGDGWIDIGGGRRVTFRGSEVVQWKLDGIALLVEGNFTGRPPGATDDVPVHTTLGVITYDPRESRYLFASWLAAGTRGERELKVTQAGWSWDIVSPRGTRRFTTTFTEDGRWVEVGEMSTDGATWTPFFGMNLKKR